MNADLVAFLLARIAEDEAHNGWHTVDCGVDLGYWATGTCVCGYPARVLAECESKRRIVEEHGGGSDPCGHAYDTSLMGWMCLTLRHLALPYADHPDYRQEWKP